MQLWRDGPHNALTANFAQDRLQAVTGDVRRAVLESSDLLDLAFFQYCLQLRDLGFFLLVQLFKLY